MSLDVYLTVRKPRKSKIMRDGKRVLYSEIYDALGIEDRELEYKDKVVYCYNCTHNLVPMATSAGVYDTLWCPSVGRAKELIEDLSSGLGRLKSNPDEYKKHNPKNGWGSYEGLVRFVESYLEACILYPDAIIQISK